MALILLKLLYAQGSLKKKGIGVARLDHEKIYAKEGF
jgi:hypothetical protein